MADFCNACARALGLPEGDLKGLTPHKAWERGLAAVAICEGCGIIQVDPDGNCASSCCLRQGHSGHGVMDGRGKKVKAADKIDSGGS